MSDEDDTRMLVVRVVLVEFGVLRDIRTNGQHYTPQQTAGRPIRQVRGKLNDKVARHARHARSILARMSHMSGVSTRMSRGCYEETAPVEFRLVAVRNMQHR